MRELMPHEIEEHRARLMAMRTEAELLAEAPGCAECMYIQNSMCGHPLNSKIRKDIITGVVDLTPQQPCGAARAEGALCGPEGLLFERNPIGKRIALWIDRIQWWKFIPLALFSLMVLVMFRRFGFFLLPFVFVGWYGLIWRED